MSNDLVIKTNRLNTAIQNLTLPELRIIQLAIIDARETGKGLSTDTPLVINALRYAEAFKTTRQNAYIIMKQAEDTLFNRQFTFLDEKGKPIKSRWLQQVRYLDDEGSIEICLTKAVVEGITRIDGAIDFFTKYLLTQTASLNSVYSVRLYELLIQWRQAKQTPVFDLMMFRGQLGVESHEYKNMCDFKKRVLNPALKEINHKTDIHSTYEQSKNGRVVNGFKFTVIQKNQLANQGDVLEGYLTPLTPKQIPYFAKLLAKDKIFQKNANPSESYDAFEKRLLIELAEYQKQKLWLADLKRLGFCPKYQDKTPFDPQPVGLAPSIIHNDTANLLVKANSEINEKINSKPNDDVTKANKKAFLEKLETMMENIAISKAIK